MAKELLRVEHIGMKFNLSKERVNDFREYVIRMLKGKKLEKDEFWALKDINFSIHEGERIGILGLNGAGKSTLLKVVAGVFKPTEGRVIRNGKIVPLLELGAGFDKDYTGRENIFLYGAVLGYGRQYMEEKYDQIVEFSGLEDFMDVPIKNYSSGMKSKLGFAIATIAEPEILILDEVLSVGDGKFRKMRALAPSAPYRRAFCRFPSHRGSGRGGSVLPIPFECRPPRPAAVRLVFPQLFFLPHQIPDFSRCSYGGFPTRPALPSRAAYLP